MKSHGKPPTDPYLFEVASSRGIVMVRAIAIWSRASQIASQCPLVSRALKHRGCLEQTIGPRLSLKSSQIISWPYSASTLLHLFAPVAEFERALLSTRAGSEETCDLRNLLRPEPRPGIRGSRAGWRASSCGTRISLSHDCGPVSARNVRCAREDIENPQAGRLYTAILNEPKVPMWQVDRQ